MTIEPTTGPIAEFRAGNAERAKNFSSDSAFQKASGDWRDLAFDRKYMYHFSWAGRPIIQLPADMVAFQELVWDVRPDLIIETGIAHGGSLMLSASMLAMLDLAEAFENKRAYDPMRSARKVVGIDIDIRDHNREAIETHPFAPMLEMWQGSSIDPVTIGRAAEFAADYKKVLVCLDSNHTHEHVLAELHGYAPLVSKSSYCLVFDTVVDDLPADAFPDRPWSKTDNPKTAVRAFLEEINAGTVLAQDGDRLQLEVDQAIEDKLLLSSAPSGYLKRV